MTPTFPRSPAFILVILFGIIFADSRPSQAQFTFASDNGGNYVSWTNGSDAGTGFGGWGFNTGTGSGSFLGSPANDGMGTSGIGTNAFGMYASGSGYFSAARGFDNAMMVGDSFSFYWAMNWDANGGGKGFDLKSSGTTIFNVNNNNSSTITTTNGNADTAYGTTPMLVTVNRTSSSQYSFSMTSRSGGATYSTTINSSNAIDNFNLYIGNQNEGSGNRNIYFNNFQITNSGNYSTGGSVTSGWAYTGTGALIVGNNTTLILTSDGNTFTGGTTVNAGSTLQIGNGGGSGSLPGSVVNNGAVTFNRTGDVTYAGSMSGSGVLNKQGAGALFLSGSSSYAGATTISAGTLEVRHANALGSTAGNTAVSSGAVLKLYHETGMSIANEGLSINGTGVSSGGALINTGGNNTWSGAVTLNGNSRINADTTGSNGSLTISGGISGGSNALFIGAQGGSSGRTGGDVSLSGSITGSGASLSSHGNTTTSVFKDGLGALTLSGSSSFTGATLLNQGTILIGNNNAFGNGFLQVHWADAAAKTLASTNSTARTIGNNLNIFNDVTLGAVDRTGSLTFSGSIALGDEAGNRTITTAAGTSHTFAGNVSGLRQIIKEGSGSLALSGSNNFSGGVQLNNGTILIGSNSALGTGTLQVQFETPGSKTIASTDASARSITNNVNVYNDLNIGQSSGGTGSLTFSGNVFLGNEVGGTRTLTVLGSHTISGNISGARGLVKQGTGTLTLTGSANTQNGTLFIDNGIVNVNTSSLSNPFIDIGAGSSGESPNNATLRFNSASTYASNLTIKNFESTGGLRTIDFASTSGTTTVSGAVTLEKAATMTVASGGTATITGAVSGAHLITKSGAGALRFNNSVAGPVTVTAGSLGGNTTIGGLVTLNSGASLAPGNSVGVGAMTFGNGLTLDSASTVRMDITASNGSADQISITGGQLTRTGNLIFDTVSMTGVTNNTYTLFTGSQTGSWSMVSVAGAYTGDFTNNSGIWTRNAGDGNVWTYNQAAGTLTVIPEPSTYALMGIGAAFVLWRLRRRKQG